VAAPEGADPDHEGAQDRWDAYLTAFAIIGFSLAWVALLALIEARVYGRPDAVVDVALYQKYAQTMVSGLLPYRDFAFEYPPLALVPILLPVLLGGGVTEDTTYRQLFALAISAIGMVTVIVTMWSIVALRRSRRDTAVAAVVLAASPLLLGPLMVGRYDLWPALFAAATIWLLATGRPRWAAVALGLGVLAKVYPVVLAPFAIVYLWRVAGRREAAWFTAITGAVVAIGLAPFLLLAPDGIIDALTRAFRRPIQVESLAAALLYAREVVTGERVRLIHTFDSYNLRGPDAELVGGVQSIALGIVLLTTLWLFFRGRPSLDRLVLACAVALTAWVAFGRVFSPQYLIWLIAPLVLVAGRRWSLPQIAIVVAIVLTGLYYPKFYARYYELREPIWVAVILGRDLVLAALCAYLVLLLRPKPLSAPT
jgi:hypothetical protein